MKLEEAINHASMFFIPELMFGLDANILAAERATNEEAIKTLVDAYFSEERPGYDFDIVLDLAERNRSLCDAMEPEGRRENRSQNLPRSLSDEDTLKGIAALQHRRLSSVKKDAGPNVDKGVVYSSKPVSGTVVGVDIETTSTSPDRGRIVNIGWAVMDLQAGSEPSGQVSAFCGLPAEYAQKGVPLEEVHHISWNMIADEQSFRENKQLQSQLLSMLTSHPYLAHNAAFEDAWFLLNLEGYAEARKKGKITPIDTRDICRALDPEVRRLGWDQHPASLENWARRRGTLAADADEVHLGLEDTELMLRTVLAEFGERELLS